MSDTENTEKFTKNAHELLEKKKSSFTLKDLGAIKKTLMASPEELKGIRNEITRLAQSDEARLIYQNGEEKIVLYRGTLSGYLNGMYFGCWCYMPGVKLFFNESKDLNTLKQSREMTPERVRQFLDELDQTMASDPALHYIRLQMNSVREMWEFEKTNLPNLHRNNSYAAQKQEIMDIQRQRIVSKQVAEAEAAKQRRLENEERTRLRKAQREAEREKRRKIAETTKRVNADASKAAAERKAEEERKAQMQKEAQLKAQEEAIREENKRTTENMLAAFDKHKNLPPVYDQDNDGNDCFYLKINNKVMHVVMSDTAPLCHQLSLEPRASTPLDVHDIQDIMTNINDHLNAKGDFDELLCNFALFYKRCQDIISNKSAIANKRAAKVSKNPKGVIVHKHTVRPLYGKVCHRLMRPSTFNIDNQR